MYEPAQMSRQQGRNFEARAERLLRNELKLKRPHEAAGLTPRAAATVRALRPENRPGLFEAQTVAEGLWVDRRGRVVWSECSGTTTEDRKSGMRRTDTVRKVGGTLNAVLSVCQYWEVDVPRVVLVTSHAPLLNSSSEEYLRWSVVEPFGRTQVELVELEESGAWRRLALPAESSFT
jgi:hypothetical protein